MFFVMTGKEMAIITFGKQFLFISLSVS